MSLHEHPPTPAEEGLRAAVARKGSLWATVVAVAWSLFGVRRNSGHAHDVSQLNPVHVILVGLVAGLVFVLALVALANWVVGSGVAA